MANNVENQVVRMEFDNKSFQQRIQDTVRALADLKTRLSFKGGTGIDDLQAKSDKFNLNGMTSQTDKVSAGFLGMATVGITALANITNRAVDAGISIARSLALDPLMDGFAEYELNMNSIQTILANTRKDGTNLDDVNAALDELNNYSDQTIYNFAQMTKNIGAATAAGVDLETATTMVKGFANSAAIAGVDATSMAGALEQMTQSLAAGVVKAQDWISLERRGLAGQVQQEAFFEMAKAVGTLKDVPLEQSFEEWQAAGNTLRGSLQEGWLTAEVFNQTMKAFSGEMTRAELAALGMGEASIASMLELGEVGVDSATKVRTLTQLFDTTQEAIASGWSESFRTVIGDFEQASELFTTLSDNIGNLVGASSQARNTTLAEWARLGGRDNLLGGLENAVKAFASVLNPIRDAFRQIFPRKTGAELAKLTQQFRDFTNRLIVSEETGDKIRRIFAGLFAVLKIGVIIVKAISKVFAGMIAAVSGAAGSGFLGFFAMLGDRLVQLQQTLANGRVEELITRIVDSFRNFVNSIDLTPVVDSLRNAWATVQAFVQGIDLTPVLNIFRQIGQAIQGLVDAGRGLAGFIGNLFGGGDGDSAAKDGEDLANALEKGESAAEKFNLAMLSIERNLKQVEGRVKEAQSNVERFAGAVNKIGQKVKGFFQPVVDVFNEVKERAGGLRDAMNPKIILGTAGVGAFAGFVLVLKNIATTFRRIQKDGLDLTGGFLPQLAGIAGDVRKTLSGVNGVLGAMQAELKASALLKIAAAIGVLAVSIALLSLIDSGKLAISLTAITVMVGQLAATLKLLEDITTGSLDAVKMIAIAFALTILAGALVLMSIALKILSTIPLEQMGTGLAGLTGGLILLIGSINNLTSDTDGLIKAGIAMGVMALSLYLLAGAIKLMALIGWKDLVVGLGGVAVSLGVLITAINSIKSEGVFKAGLAIALLSGALYLLVGAIRLISLMDPGEVVLGLGTIAAALTGMVLALNRINHKSVLSKAAAILAIGLAMNLMARAVRKMGNIPWDKMLLGLGGLAGVMTILTVALRVMGQGQIEKAGFGMLLMSFALQGLSKAIIAMGSVPFGVLIQGFLGLAVALGGMALLSYILTPFISLMGGLGLALLAAGGGLALMGFGAYYLARALGVLAKSGVGALDELWIVIESFLARLPELAAALAAFGLSFAENWLTGMQALVPLVLELLSTVLTGIGEMAPQFFETAVIVLTEFLAGVQEIVPDVVETLFSVISEFLTGLADFYDDMIQAGLDILTEFISGIADNVDDIAEAVTTLVTEFIDAMGESYTDITEEGAEFIGELITGIGEAALDIVEAGADAVTKFLEGVASKSLEVVDAGFQIIIDFLNGLAETIEERTPELIDAGVRVMASFYQGILNYFRDYVGPWLSGLGGRIKDKIGDLFELLKQKGINLLSGFFGGIVERSRKVNEWFLKLPGRLVGFVGDTSRRLLHAGKDLIRGLWDGILSMKDWVEEKIGGFANDVVSFFTNPWFIESPSRVMRDDVGIYLSMGLADGIEKGLPSVKKAANNVSTAISSGIAPETSELKKSVESMAAELSSINLEKANPVITPVLDTSTMEKQLNSFQQSSIGIGTSIDNASAASVLQQLSIANAETESASNNIEITQNNYSPKALSTADIYRQTKGLVAITKEELGIR